MKIFRAMLLSGILLMLLLFSAGCGSAEVQEKTEQKQPQPQEQTQTVTADSAEETEDAEPIIFEEYTPIDTDICRVTVKSIDPNGAMGYTLNMELENKSPDTTYLFYLDTAYINGVECSPIYSTEVPAGETVENTAAFMMDKLEENGITEVTDIEIDFLVFDSANWLAEYEVEETFHIYPYGEERAAEFERKSVPTDIVLADTEEFSAVIVDMDKKDSCGCTADLYLKNRTDKELTFAVENVKVNGTEVNPFYSEGVAPGKSEFSAFVLLSSLLEENGISDVKEIEFQYRVYDMCDWDADDIINETVTLKP